MVSDGDAHVLSIVEPGLVAAVAGQDVMTLQHVEYHFISRPWWQDLAEEIVGL